MADDKAQTPGVDLDPAGKRLALEAEKATAAAIQSTIPAVEDAPTGEVTVGEGAGSYGPWLVQQTLEDAAVDGHPVAVGVLWVIGRELEWAERPPDGAGGRTLASRQACGWGVAAVSRGCVPGSLVGALGGDGRAERGVGGPRAGGALDGRPRIRATEAGSGEPGRRGSQHSAWRVGRATGSPDPFRTPTRQGGALSVCGRVLRATGAQS